MIHLPAALQNKVTNQELPRLREIPKNTVRTLKEVHVKKCHFKTGHATKSKFNQKICALILLSYF